MPAWHASLLAVCDVQWDYPIPVESKDPLQDQLELRLEDPFVAVLGGKQVADRVADRASVGQIGGSGRNLGAVVITSLLFSAAHYIGPQGDSWQLYSFVFRFLAGGFFAVLFVYRGFGIAAGTHALYDIFVGLF